MLRKSQIIWSYTVNNNKKICIVGGVAGGASAAARARRLSEDAEIILFERGTYISFANCGLPYHIGGTIADRNKLLVQTPKAMHRRFRIDVRTGTEVVAINREKREITVKSVKTGEETIERYDELVLSPGAEPLRPPIPGVDDQRVRTLRNMDDMDAIISALNTNAVKRAIVVGGGYIGLEMTEALRERGVEVVLVELAKQVMVTADPEMASPIKQQLELHGVDLRLNTSITTIEKEEKRLIAHLSTGETLEADLLLLNVGVRPETKLAADAGLAIGERGGIVVDDHMRTSDPHIYAVGDVIEVTDLVGRFQTVIPLAGPANRQGRIAADNIFGRESAYHGTQGTAICKVFDLAIAMTGMNEKNLKRIGKPYEKVYVHPASHASYYPGASPISLKLLFDPSDGKILGAQAVGLDGVDKRIDVLAMAIRAGMTVYDLEHVELTYAPPFGSAKDPVNYAGFVVSNVLRGDAHVCHFEDVTNLKDNQYLIDVRTKFEVEAGTIPGAHNIPIDEIRDRIDEIPRDKEILIACHVGLRGYLACRILTQHGFICKNLTGGYKTYRMFQEALPEDEVVTTDMSDDSGEITHKIPATAPQKESAAVDTTIDIVTEIDATGLQCPGPIVRLSNEMDKLPAGKALTITVTDPGFVKDVPAWCHSTGHVLIDIIPNNGNYTATIRKHGNGSTGGIETLKKHKTIVVFSSELDRVLAAFIIANGAASMGSKVTLFFTFWGLNVLRKDNAVKIKKSFKEALFGKMMPRGPKKLSLSKMHFGGVGKNMLSGIMKEKNVNTLPELMETACQFGVKLVACSMSMDVMGIRKEELVDGVEIGGVAMYLDQAEEGNVNLFV